MVLQRNDAVTVGSTTFDTLAVHADLTEYDASAFLPTANDTLAVGGVVRYFANSYRTASTILPAALNTLAVVTDEPERALVVTAAVGRGSVRDIRVGGRFFGRGVTAPQAESEQDQVFHEHSFFVFQCYDVFSCDDTCLCHHRKRSGIQV